MTQMFPSDSLSQSTPKLTRRYATLRTVVALILREMSSRYGRTPGGYVWAILEPIGAILVLSVAFSFVVRAPALGTDFFLYYATGYLPFMLYQTTSNTVAQAIAFSRPLLRYPSVLWVDALMARFALNATTGAIIVFVILGGSLLSQDTRTSIDVGKTVGALALSGILGFSVGSINCFLYGMWPIWKNLWSIITRPLFLASGVFFTYDVLPPGAQKILWYNPLMHISGLLRDGIYATYSPTYISLSFVFTFALALTTLGLLLLKRHHKQLL